MDHYMSSFTFSRYMYKFLIRTTISTTLGSFLLRKLQKSKVYALSEVFQHKTKEDCWFIINGRVLDVTVFIDEHPGGEEVLLEYAGKDATRAFENIGHSKAALNLVSKYYVGHLQGYDNIADHGSNVQVSSKAKQMEAYVIKGDSGLKNSTVLEFFVPLLAAVLYFGYRLMS